MARLAAAAAALWLLAPAAAGAHEVLHQVARGRAVAVRAYTGDGAALAGARFEVYSPAEPGSAFLRGRTDGAGWLAFVPDAAGRWRVRVIDDEGHGLDAAVEVGGDALSAGGGEPSAAARALRPLLGAGAIGAAFAALFAFRRRRPRPGPRP